jgi:hypothetical protein
MVVVDNARKMISKTIDIVVTSVLQTTAGKMIFGRYIDPNLAAQGGQSSTTGDRDDARKSTRIQPNGTAGRSGSSPAVTPIAAAPATSNGTVATPAPLTPRAMPD